MEAWRAFLLGVGGNADEIAAKRMCCSPWGRSRTTLGEGKGGVELKERKGN